MLDWIDAYHSVILSRWGSSTITRPNQTPRFAVSENFDAPWRDLTTTDLVRLFRAESWAGTLVPQEFARVLDRLGLDGEAIGPKLFAAFDQDGNGELDFRELFLGMSLLLGDSREQRLASQEVAGSRMQNRRAFRR